MLTLHSTGVIDDLLICFRFLFISYTELLTQIYMFCLIVLILHCMFHVMDCHFDFIASLHLE